VLHDGPPYATARFIWDMSSTKQSGFAGQIKPCSDTTGLRSRLGLSRVTDRAPGRKLTSAKKKIWIRCSSVANAGVRREVSVNRGTPRSGIFGDCSAVSDYGLFLPGDDCMFRDFSRAAASIWVSSHSLVLAPRNGFADTEVNIRSPISVDLCQVPCSKIEYADPALTGKIYSS
jgi:hypothetical protein